MKMELTEYFHAPDQRKTNKADISLSGVLEAFVGNYYVSGDGAWDPAFHWLTIYYDPSIDTDFEAVETISSNIVAYVSSDYRWGFVLNRHLQKFRKDASDYDISCIPVPDFESESLQCLHPERLPDAFSDLLWIDDDFLNDETIPFDFDRFALIDTGVCYLNPKHFSAAQLICTMDHRRDGC